VISKSHFHKLLEIKLLQNSIYGRLSRRRYSCAGGRPWVQIYIWRQPGSCASGLGANLGLPNRKRKATRNLQYAPSAGEPERGANYCSEETYPAIGETLKGQMKLYHRTDQPEATFRADLAVLKVLTSSRGEIGRQEPAIRRNRRRNFFLALCEPQPHASWSPYFSEIVLMRLMSGSGFAHSSATSAKKCFKSGGSDIDEYADWLIRIVFETVDRAAGE
jgi:hypothetical protein